MEVHHHTHTPRRKWTHYFWEFFMLFLAVTLGFLVENMREHYIERQRVKVYARALVEDLTADTQMIHYHIHRIKLFIRMTDSLSAYLKNREIEEISNLDLFTLSTVDRYPPYIWNRATIDQIKNSGSLRYFPPGIVRQIASYSALSYHLDDDFKNDEDMGNQAALRRNQLINMDYPSTLWMGMRNNIDSVIKTEYYQTLRLTDSTRLLAKNTDEIRVFLNEKLNMRKHFIIRSDEELSTLLIKARSLISSLKLKYNIE